MYEMELGFCAVALHGVVGGGVDVPAFEVEGCVLGVVVEIGEAWCGGFGG